MTAVTVGSPLAHHEDLDTIGRRWRTGLALLIVADAAFVGSLVFSYFYLRGLNTDGHWFPRHSPIAPIWVGWVIAAGAVLSAGAYRWGQEGFHSGKESRLALGAGVAVLLVVADVVGQVVQIATLPFGVKHSSYSSSIYVFAGANLFHLLLTLFVGVGIWNRVRLGRHSPSNDWQVRLVGIWWTWIALAAVISAFTTSFVASPNHITG
jgi:heme/copper-type cytochrome/quinol oxidase subunit 3